SRMFVQAAQRFMRPALSFWSLGGPAAVDREHVSCDQTGFVGQQEADGSDDVLGLADALKGYVRQHLLAERGVFEHRRGQGCVDEGGRDRVDTYLVLCPFERESL